MNCGRCNNDYSALTERGYCPSCDFIISKEMKQQKLDLIKIIYDNNFNVEIISTLTKKSVSHIIEFIKFNNLKKMNDNNYTCVSCSKTTNQLFSRYERTGLCSECINKMENYNKKAKRKEMLEHKTEFSTISNTLTTNAKQIKESETEYVEHTTKLPAEEVEKKPRKYKKLDMGTPTNKKKK